MKTTNFLATLIIAAVFFTSCGKKDEVSCIAGMGGYLQVTLVPKYNGNDVYATSENPVKAYIAFDAPDFPGDNHDKYNKSVSAKKNENFVVCGNLRCGIYYFYVVGTDPATGKSISGGRSLVTEQQDGVIEMNIDLY